MFFLQYFSSFKSQLLNGHLQRKYFFSSNELLKNERFKQKKLLVRDEVL